MAKNWRWAYGTFIITFVACVIPTLIIMIIMFRKAKKAGLIHKEKSDRNVLQSIWYYYIQFDSKLNIRGLSCIIH
jgi:uncharacterized protein YjaG (DUF416 family)